MNGKLTHGNYSVSCFPITDWWGASRPCFSYQSARGEGGRYATPPPATVSRRAAPVTVVYAGVSGRVGRVSELLSVSVSVSVVTLSSPACCEGVCGGDGRGPMGLCVGALRAWWARRWTTSEPMEGRGKEAVHKCHSDPGGSARRVRAIGGRKCVLTLDGYSYVIGERVDSVINKPYSNSDSLSGPAVGNLRCVYKL